MDLEPHLIKKQSSEIDSSFFNKETDQLSSDDEDPYSFNSTSTSLIGLAIVFVMLGIPLLAVISERPDTQKSIIPTSIKQNGLESSSPITITWISKSSC
ncbi:hypothetical protein [Prochlorococcus marinus]|uniref:Uncharacterized protein n=1 Tax=Prochlorococcus marinus XMU1408 TaxID=2213228 RepID=A0A318R180_PROMR|nr:hypothetical protein [Prochlorococcus marinus]MBW3041537.1 hypothetical protein [Prochlorococcus marinus str. XMU1408]PYE02695.1 hypothetical protein DNJ73_02785 [Prochlorococcus marinus XMU1408]